MEEQEGIKRVQAIIICIVVGLFVLGCIGVYIYKFSNVVLSSDENTIQLKENTPIEYEDIVVDSTPTVDNQVVETVITPTPTPIPVEVEETTESEVQEEVPEESTIVEEDPAEEVVENTEEYIEEESQPDIEVSDEITDSEGNIEDEVIMDIPVEDSMEQISE